MFMIIIHRFILYKIIVYMEFIYYSIFININL